MPFIIGGCDMSGIRFFLLLIVGCVMAAMLIGNAFSQQREPQELKDELANAPELPAHEGEAPVRTVRMGMMYWVVHPDGQSYDLLQVYFPSYGGPNTIVGIDIKTGRTRTYQTDRGPNYHLAPVIQSPDNFKFYISNLNPGLRQGISIYDPNTKEFTVNALDIPDTLLGETHPLALGTDGKIYAFGQHPDRTVSAVQIDPRTNEVTDYGSFGPSHAPNACWAYSGAADDRYLYVASGKVPWYLVAYDRRTGEWETLVETEPVGGMVGVSQGRYGATGFATGIKGTDGTRQNYWLYKGKAIIREAGDNNPPWPAPDKDKPLLPQPEKPEVSRAFAVPTSDGRAQIWVRSREAAEAAKAADIEAPENAKPQDFGWNVFNYRVPTYAQTIHRCMELPDGRIFGTAGAYEGNFIFDPRTNRAEHMGKIGLSHYATTMHNGLIYMSGYPTSPLFVYDPNKPWTANTPTPKGETISERSEESNPRMIDYMGKKEYAGTHKMYGATTGADGRVYFGGTWIRDGSCGGLAWYDPETGEMDGMWEPFSNYQINYMTSADNGRIIVISTRAVRDPILGKETPEQGRLFFFDTDKQEIAGHADPVPRARCAGLVVGVGGHYVLGWNEDPQNDDASLLYLVDATSGNIVRGKKLPFKIPVRIGSNQKESFDYRLGPDGQVWTFMEGALVRINPRDLSITPVGRINPGGRLAFSGQHLYLGGKPELRRVPNLVTRIRRR